MVARGDVSIIYLHIGLHKTATTTLQYHVFPNLQKIEFLGRGKGGRMAAHALYNSLGKYVHAEGVNVRMEESLAARFFEHSTLYGNLLISEEWFTADYSEFYGFNGAKWQDKLAKLGRIFQGQKTKLLITIRNPLDNLYSQYCEFRTVGVEKYYPDFGVYLEHSNDARVFLLDEFDALVCSLFVESERIYLDFSLIVSGEFESILREFFNNPHMKVGALPNENAKFKGVQGVVVEKDSFRLRRILEGFPKSWYVFFRRFEKLRRLLASLQSRYTVEVIVDPISSDQEAKFRALFPDAERHYKRLCANHGELA